MESSHKEFTHHPRPIPGNDHVARPRGGETEGGKLRRRVLQQQEVIEQLKAKVGREGGRAGGRSVDVGSTSSAATFTRLTTFSSLPPFPPIPPSIRSSPSKWLWHGKKTMRTRKDVPVVRRGRGRRSKQ